MIKFQLPNQEDIQKEGKIFCLKLLQKESLFHPHKNFQMIQPIDPNLSSVLGSELIKKPHHQLPHGIQDLLLLCVLYI